MAGCRLRLKFTIVLCILFVNILKGESSKLNVPRVLLPLFQQFSTNFTLEVSENGCYKWSSSRPDIVQVIQVDIDEVHQCSIKAVVSAITKEPIRNTVIVLAEEVKSGLILRCDVIVDVIKSLSIVTTTRELFMEEAPEMFEVRASDNQGNEFTSLEGVEFQWNIENVAQFSSTNQVLRFIRFIDSPYETPPTVEKFDALGLRGHMVLIEGVKTGAAKVSVQLPHSEYKEIPKIEVVLTVVANLLLDPPDTHILAGDTVRFRLLQMQHGKLDEIALPSAQYVLDVENSEVIVIDRSVSTVRGVRVGQSRVVLRDRHSLDSESGVVKLPTAVVVVTEPAYLRLTLMPHNNWAVLVDEPATIQVQIYDRLNHRVHIGDAVTVRTVVSESYFRVFSMTRNGSVIDGTAIKVGTVPVTATLESVRAIGGTEIKLKPVITAQEDMLIYPRLAVTPSHIIIPWDPTISKFEVQLTATGGDGLYSWRSNSPSIMSVSQSGVAKCNGLGETSIIVSMSRNPSIKVSSQIEVLSPSHIEILKHALEAPVYKPIILHVVLYADKEDNNGNLRRVPFSHCQTIQFRVELSNANFYQNTTEIAEPVQNACATVSVFGKTIGTSKVKVTYQVKDIVLEAITEVAAYNPLEVVHPERKITVLALGTSRHIVWKGGPRVWLGRPAEHTRSVSADSLGIKIDEVTSNKPSEFYVYSVLCKELGEFNVKLTVKNNAVNGHFKQSESTSSVKVICAKPRYITFSPANPVNASCPYSTDSTQIVALNYEPIKILVTITDSQSRVFDNATSYHIDWTLSSKPLGYIQFDGIVVLEEEKEHNYIIPLDHYQIIYPKNRTGTLVVEATVLNYRLQLLSNLKITPEQPVFWIKNEEGVILKPVIKNSLTIVLVNASTITPDRATIFNHPNNKIILKVAHGSGFFTFQRSSFDIADVQYQDNSKSVEIIPKAEGLLLLTLIDLCLSYKSPIVEIQVLKVGSMQVEMLDRVQKGNTITATVWLYDSVENTLTVPNAEFLELRPHLENNLVSITRLQSDGPNGEIKFNITGLELGTTSLTFTSGFGDREIRSQPQPLHVFPPLRLNPQDITLAVGALFQVTPVGGPQPDCVMEYISSDPTIAKINSEGLIETLKVGDMYVTGQAVGFSRSTGNKVVYSNDVVNVHVINLEGVKIRSPLLKIKAGCKMPVWATGVPEKLTPLVLGSLQPPLIFKWSTSVSDIIELQDVFHISGVEVPDRDRLSMKVAALKPGRVTLHLNVTTKATRYSNAIDFTDHLDIEIFEELKITKPQNYKTSSLLMAPFSHIYLRSNKESVSEVTYKVIGLPDSDHSMSQNTALTNNIPVVSVTPVGVVTSYAAFGSASVLVQAVEESGLKQTLPVNIEVKPVNYIMLNVKTKLHLGLNKVISALPRGLDLDFTVSYHDNSGEMFASTRTDIRIEQNRFDCVKVVRGEVNGTLVAKLVGYGPSVLKVQDETTPKISQDFIKLRVDHLITPSKTEMTVGDIACFSMPLFDSGNTPGVWTSGNPEVMVMEAPSGMARALHPGQALIKYSLSDTITTSTFVQVFPIQSIVFFPLDGRNLTNWGSFSVPLLLLGEHDSHDKSSNLLAQDNHCPFHSFSLAPHHFPFACEIRFNSPMTPVHIQHVFNVQPSFSIETGLYSCFFESLNPLSSNTSVLTSNVTLRAISDHLVSEPLVIPFLPSVYLPVKELLISDQQMWATLPIIGIPQILAQVQVFSCDTALLSVVEAKKPDSNTMLFEVTLACHSGANHLHRQLYLNVLSPLTRQNITVPVYINFKSGMTAPCLAKPTAAWFQHIESLWSITSSIISIAVIIIVFCYYNYSTPTATNIYHNGSPAPPQLAETRPFLYRQPFSDAEPVYGDPNLSPSPELNRRNRR